MKQSRTAARAFSSQNWTFQKGRLNTKKLRDKALIDETIDQVNLVFPDQYGRLTGLKVNAEYFLERVEASEAGAHFEIKQNPFRFDALGKKIEIPEDVQMPKSLLLTPDLSTLREMSWQKKEALVMADVLHPETKRLLPYAPRHILR